MTFYLNNLNKVIVENDKNNCYLQLMIAYLIYLCF